MSGAPDVDDLRRAGVVAVLRAPSVDAAVEATRALIAGGVTGIEVTYSTPGAAEVIARARAEHGSAAVVGAGTLLRPSQVAEAHEAGASFLVSPGSDDAVVAAMRLTGATVCVGALTPTELMAIGQSGADVAKLFPASLGGPAYLRSLRGPFPDLAIMPTGGVDPSNLGEWFAAGAVAVGAGSELCSAALMAAGDWTEITRRARAFTAALAAVREAAA
jgi:2-dehydro-3-deoxyphosphogluconate aldolase / (4S)-4-hydroxy-2-oxoglutarate aldolase